MTQITLTEVDKIANLARLSISEEEKARYAHDLSNIFELVDQLSQSTDLNEVEPLFNSSESNLRLRDDVVTEPDQRALFQSIAPLTQAGLYLVPKVVE